MQGVNPAAIRKKKKGEVEMESAKTNSLVGANELKANTPSLVGANELKAKTGSLVGANQLKAKTGSIVEGIKDVSAKTGYAKPPKSAKMPEAEIEIELMIQDAKKKKKESEPKPQDSYTEDLGYFTTGRSGKDGTWKESGESRAKYLRKLKSMKK